MIDFIIIAAKDDINDFMCLINGFDNSNANILINPSKGQIRKLLKASTNDLVICGHGDEGGVYNFAMNGYIIDGNVVDMLRKRNIVGNWCYAGNFADRYGLHGFFTSMFISNIDEANWFNIETTPDIITSENIRFASCVNELLRKNVPYSEWLDILQSNANVSNPLVRFNYEAMAYYE